MLLLCDDDDVGSELSDALSGDAFLELDGVIMACFAMMSAHDWTALSVDGAFDDANVLNAGYN